ncbi:MAG: regulatory protein GemA [Aestuariibacter sp.]|nr:regulatory protein GemA [Aestuariibacter sp.]
MSTKYSANRISRATQSKIHIARQQLGLDEEVYREVLQRATGSSSSKSMTERQGRAALIELKRLGFKPKPTAKKDKGKPHNFDKLPEMITKIEAQLADMELPWAYADSIANRMWKRQRIAWTSEPDKLKAIMSALYYEQEKRSLLASVEKMMTIVGPTDPKWQAHLESLPKGWKRHLPTLKALNVALGAVAYNLQFEE